MSGHKTWMIGIAHQLNWSPAAHVAQIVLASALALIATQSAPAQTQATNSQQQAIDRLTAEATARSKAGVPQDEVENWLLGEMKKVGVQTDERPPDWDVFGVAAWERRNGGQMASDDSFQKGQNDKISGNPVRKIVDAEHEQDQAQDQASTSGGADTVGGEGHSAEKEIAQTSFGASNSQSGAVVYTVQPAEASAGIFSRSGDLSTKRASDGKAKNGGRGVTDSGGDHGSTRALAPFDGAVRGRPGRFDRQESS